MPRLEANLPPEATDSLQRIIQILDSTTGAEYSIIPIPMEDFQRYLDNYTGRINTIRSAHLPLRGTIDFGCNLLAEEIAMLPPRMSWLEFRRNRDLERTFKNGLIGGMFLECTKVTPTKIDWSDFEKTMWPETVLNPRQVIALMAKYGFEKGLKGYQLPNNKSVAQDLGCSSSLVETLLRDAMAILRRRREELFTQEEF